VNIIKKGDDVFITQVLTDEGTNEKEYVMLQDNDNAPSGKAHSDPTF